MLAVAAVGAVAVLWGLFVSPKATFDLARPLRFAIELCVRVAAGAALYATGHARLALAFAAVAVASGSLNYAWSAPD